MEGSEERGELRVRWGERDLVDPRRAERGRGGRGRGRRGAGLPEAAEECEDGRETICMVVVPVGEDYVGDVGFGRVVLAGGVEKGRLEEGNVLVLTCPGVNEDIGVVLAEEVSVRPCVRLCPGVIALGNHRNDLVK